MDQELRDKIETQLHKILVDYLVTYNGEMGDKIVALFQSSLENTSAYHDGYRDGYTTAKHEDKAANLE